MSLTSNSVFRASHALVALAAGTICIVFGLAKGGHPPGFVYIPIILIYWVFAHGILIALKRILAYMAKPDPRTATEGWPPLLTLIAIASGLMLLPLPYAVFHDLVIRSKWTELTSWMWAIMFLAPPGLLFGGIMFGAITGSMNARWIAAAGPISYIGFIIAHLINGSLGNSWLSVIFVSSFCMAISSYFLLSSNVRTFFASRR